MRLLILHRREIIKIKAVGIGLLICTALLSVQPCFAITQKQVEMDVMPLIEAAAVLNVCFESSSYKSIQDGRALDLHSLRFRIEALIEKLAVYYDGDPDSLLMSYDMISIEMSSDPELITFVKEKYQNCGSKLFEDMENYVTEAEKKIRSFVSKNAKSKN